MQPAFRGPIRFRSVCFQFVVGVMSLLLVVALGTPARLAAQQSSPPPLPIVYSSGEVYVDGKLLTGQATLSARVGDWESSPVTVQDGRFTCAGGCLQAGPPNMSYIGQRVTFHLNGGQVADLEFDFPLLGAPDFRTGAFHFGNSAATLSATGTSQISPMVWGAAGSAVAMLVLLGRWLLRKSAAGRRAR